VLLERRAKRLISQALFLAEVEGIIASAGGKIKRKVVADDRRLARGGF
jgi:hypothetical protein